jgi:heterodisulfide reductase subunit C2
MDTLTQPAETEAASVQDAFLDRVKEMLAACIQCGTCSASCPNAFAMDYTPRRLWRMVLSGRTGEIFHSKTFSLCSSCYYCTLRCPRGLKLTEAMAALKQIAAQRKLPDYKKSNLFYQQFMASVRRHGRVREMEFMSLYFASLKNPLVPLGYASLGLKLMRKGKVAFTLPSKGQGRLDAIFKKVQQLEATQ